jgi:hypothetical protein
MLTQQHKSIKFRPSSKTLSLPPRHSLEIARIQVEKAIITYQSLLYLEQDDHSHHRTMPVPRILAGEAAAHAALADVLRLQSTLCHHRSNEAKYLSARGETATDLYELATQYCDVSAGMAGTLGNSVVEAQALRALSDVAASRHVDDVAEHRLQRAIDLLLLLPKKQLLDQGGRIQRQLDQMTDKRRERQLSRTTRRQHLIELRRTLGRSVVAEEKKVTDAYMEVAKRRQVDSSEANKILKDEDAKKLMLDMDGVFELTQRLGTSPALSEDELFEIVYQMITGTDGVETTVTEQTTVSLEDVLIWWFDGTVKQ